MEIFFSFFLELIFAEELKDFSIVMKMPLTKGIARYIYEKQG